MNVWASVKSEVKMIKFKDFYVSDSDYEEQMELFQKEHPNAEFIQITGGHMSPERIWFKYDDKLKEQPKLSIPKKIAEMLDIGYACEGDEERDHSWLIHNMDDFTSPESYDEFYSWLEDSEDNYSLAIAYLAGKALGVELVEVTDD